MDTINDNDIIQPKTGFIRLRGIPRKWSNGKEDMWESHLRIMFTGLVSKSVVFFSEDLEEVKLSLTIAEARHLAELIIRELGDDK